MHPQAFGGAEGLPPEKQSPTATAAVNKQETVRSPHALALPKSQFPQLPLMAFAAGCTLRAGGGDLCACVYGAGSFMANVLVHRLGRTPSSKTPLSHLRE